MYEKLQITKTKQKNQKKTKKQERPKTSLIIILFNLNWNNFEQSVNSNVSRNQKLKSCVFFLINDSLSNTIWSQNYGKSKSFINLCKLSG